MLLVLAALGIANIGKKKAFVRIARLTRYRSRYRKTSPKMKHLAAYLLLGLGGNTSPSASDVKEVLDSVGIEADAERLEKLISELQGKDISEV